MENEIKFFTFRYMNIKKKEFVFDYVRVKLLLFSCLSHLNGRFFLLLFIFIKQRGRGGETTGHITESAKARRLLLSAIRVPTFLFRFSLLFRKINQP